MNSFTFAAQKDQQMSDKEEMMDSSDSHDSGPSSVKKNGRTSLLDSGEDFEVLDDDIDDEPPPLEDAGGGKEKSPEEEAEEADLPCPVEEWLDVLGVYQKVITSESDGMKRHCLYLLTLWLTNGNISQ